MRPDTPPVFSRLSNRGESFGGVNGLCIRGGFFSSSNRSPFVLPPKSHLLSKPFARLFIFLTFRQTLLGSWYRWFRLRCQYNFLSHPVILWFHISRGWSDWRTGNRIYGRRRGNCFHGWVSHGPCRCAADHKDEKHAYTPKYRCRKETSGCAHMSPKKLCLRLGVFGRGVEQPPCPGSPKGPMIFLTHSGMQSGHTQSSSTALVAWRLPHLSQRGKGMSLLSNGLLKHLPPVVPRSRSAVCPLPIP
jgi:hypothetical protein